MNFDDIFKSSFLDNITSVSLIDMAIAMALAFGLGLLSTPYIKPYSGVMYSSSFSLTLIS